MDRERLERQFDFIKEIDKEKFIQRQTKLSDGVRRENDAEHAWHQNMPMKKSMCCGQLLCF